MGTRTRGSSLAYYALTLCWDGYRDLVLDLQLANSDLRIGTKNRGRHRNWKPKLEAGTGNWNGGWQLEHEAGDGQQNRRTRNWTVEL